MVLVAREKGAKEAKGFRLETAVLWLSLKSKAQPGKKALLCLNGFRVFINYNCTATCMFGSRNHCADNPIPTEIMDWCIIIRLLQSNYRNKAANSVNLIFLPKNYIPENPQSEFKF